MDNCLLIGNGLNRCLEHGVSWGNLLQGVADDLGVSYNPEITMPLEFERIINEYLASNPEDPTPHAIYNKVKRKISDKVSGVELPTNAIHHQLKKLNLNAVLTTNYDLLLEYVFDGDYKYDGSTLRKYLFDSTSTIKSTDFYHIHGIADNPNSLCLGYEHYMGMVENLRSALNTKKDGKTYEMLIKRVLCGEDKPSNTWGERFYTSNIAIIGLELSESESDLWWLVTHRAYLYYSNYAKLHSQIRNNLVFYDVIDEFKKNDSEEIAKQQAKNRIKLNRHKLLEKEHVIVKPLILGRDYGSYVEAYQAAIDDIRANGISDHKEMERKS